MFKIYLFSTILIVLLWLYLKWHKMKTFWIKKGIPQCVIHPIFGSLKLSFLQKISPNVWLSNVYNEYSSPYVGTWLFWRPGLIVNSPTIAQNVLLNDANIFRNRLLGTGKRDKIGCNNIFTVNDPLWSSIRKRLTHTFTPAKLRGWQNLYSTKSNDLVERIKSDNEKGVKNNLKSLFADYSTDIIGESAFGIKCQATKNSIGPLREMTKEFEKFSPYRGLQWFLIFFFPELADFLRFTFWPNHTLPYFKKIFNLIIEERGGYEKETNGNKDMMDALLKIKQDAKKQNENIEEHILISNAMIFLQGGYETTSTLLSYVTYELAYHQQYQVLLYEELITIKNTTEHDFDGKDLAELPYLNAVIKETMRKYPVMGWLDRVALQDYRIDENLTIPAGTAVLVNVAGLHYDPKYFPEPHQFKPERFLPHNEREIFPYTYMPFGEGPRFCIGKLFGMYSMRYALAEIIVNFIIKPLPNKPVPNDVGFDSRGILITPSGILSVEFSPRN